MSFLNRFWAYIWAGRIDNVDSELVNIIVDEGNIDEPYKPRRPEQRGLSTPVSTSQEQVRNHLTITISRFLVLVCGVSFVVIIIYALFYPDKSVPEIVETAFLTTLGWFGGVLGTFFQFDRYRK